MRGSNTAVSSIIIRLACCRRLSLVAWITHDRPMHNVVFATGYEDRIFARGRRRGMQFPYDIEVMQKRHYPDLSEHNAPSMGPHFICARLSRVLRDHPVVAPKPAARRRARS